MTRSRASLLTLTTLALAPALGAQALGPQARPPIRPLAAVHATTSDSLGMVNNVRALPGGRLLINDATSRRVLLVDSTFKLISIVADSTSSTANAYGPRSGSLIAFRGDSTLFVDAASLSMLVIDPAGKIGRVMSVPRSQDAMMLAAGGLGTGAYYSNGYLVYRGMPGIRMQMSASGAPTMPSVADTMAIVRVNLQSRAVDTVGFIRIPKTNTNMTRSDDGKISISIEVNPLPVVDDWVVTSGGDIALIRGKDYHVDWMSPDGTHRSSPKMAFDWKRLSDEQKVALIDSVKAIRDRAAAANPGEGNQMAAAFGAALGTGGAAGGAAPQMVMRFEARGGPGGPPGGGAAPQINYVSPSDLPDYQPAFFATSAKADDDGNIWIRTIPTKPQAGGAVYDVVNGKGEVIDRVQIPENRTIVGFGPGGVVILAARDGMTTKLERARVK